MEPTTVNPSGRRLRRKTTVGQLAVLLSAVVPPALPTVAAAAWSDEFLFEEDLEPESDKRKAVYLVTLPHPPSTGRLRFACTGQLLTPRHRQHAH